jgi:diacylglycerol kinase family enzyme
MQAGLCFPVNGTVLVLLEHMTAAIPAIINRQAGGATDAARILAEVGGYDVEEVDPQAIFERVRAVAASRPKRILVAGGDGSLCTAVHALGDSGIELAILPAGTLNHLAKHLGLPADLREAAVVGREGILRPVDAGRVNDRLFLNTSSVGAYETFVRRREAIEGRWGYHLASVIAGWRILVGAPILRLTVEVEGVKSVYRTPLVFVGVGERELRIPALGARIEHGRRGLHVMIVRHRSGARLASLAIQAAARGVNAVARTPAMDSLIVDRFSIEGGRRTASVDGELIDVSPPLDYEFLPAALRVVVAERRAAGRPAVLEV